MFGQIKDVGLPEVTLPIDQPLMRRVEIELFHGAKAVAVARSKRQKPHGNCYWNVDWTVKERGGVPVLGWAIYTWPQLYVVAVHHSVWRPKSGELVDVSSPSEWDTASPYTSFVPDETVSIDLERVACVENRFLPLNQSREIIDHITRQNIDLALKRKIADILWESGYRNQHLFAVASDRPMPEASFPGLPLNVEAKLKQLHDRRDAITPLLREATERLFRLHQHLAFADPE